MNADVAVFSLYIVQKCSISIAYVKKTRGLFYKLMGFSKL